jgi:hypothetical protein
MDKLLNMGFEKAAQTNILNGNLKIEILKNKFASNLLYVFIRKIGDNISDWQVFYIGHTRKSLKNRLLGYQAGNGVATNNRIHNAVIEIINSGGECYIFALFNKFQMQIHGIDIDIAAAVEYSLIEYYSNFNSENNHPPLLNKAGNANYLSNIPSEYIEELKEDIISYDETDNYDESFKIEQFEYKLNQTYWNTSNINIPIEFQNLFGENGEIVMIEFYERNNFINNVEVQINRNANLNKTPRLYIPARNGKKWFIDWKQKNFKEKDTIIIKIVGYNRLSITA